MLCHQVGNVLESFQGEQVKAARKNRPQVTVTCFVPCSDEHNDWYNRGGQYIAITGTVKKVDCSAILIDDMMIALEDIAGIDMCDVNT